MKLKITVFLFLVGFFASAQNYHHISPPKTYWKSYGFQKQPDHAKIAYYKISKHIKNFELLTNYF